MNNKVKFLRGTATEYENVTKDNDTIYFTTDDGKLYIGDKKISGDGSLTIDDTLSDTSTNPVQNKVVKQAIDNKADSSHTHVKAEITDFPTSLPANGGDAATVNGYTVNANVPALGYYYATCDSPLSTNIKTVTCEGFEFKEGARITICFTTGNGDNPPSEPVYVLKINEDAGRPIAYNDWDGEGIISGINSKKSEAFCSNQVWDFIFIKGRFIMQAPLRGYQMDDTLSNTSRNPVQNKVIKAAIDDKADKTVATTEADGLMSASDKKRFNNIGNVYALKSLYGDTTIDVGRKTGTDVGICSDAEGWHTTASGNYSHTEGLSTTASNRCSHAEGVSTVASGESSHAEGAGAVAFGDYSHARGYNTRTNNTCETASGKYNVSNDNTLFSIGDGTADNARHNAFEITTTGGKLHDKDIATTDLIPTERPANGGNADTIDGLHANDFTQIINFGESETDTKTAIGKPGKTAIYRCTKWTDYPAEFIDGQGTLIAVNYNGSEAVGTGWTWCTQIIVNPRSGNKMFIRYTDTTYVSDWKEISTTPTRSTDIFGTTDPYSNLLLWKVTDARKPILVTINGYYAIPFLTADRDYFYYYAGLINCSTHEYIPNTPVSGTVYYIEV